MPEETLRAYAKDIDQLIERERLDEAIAHCRHILQTYPKHLETYRLLGKAYLEAKRYGDAADIFQRVLSAVPDDFVSHIGMAIVREDEGNLDAAIWHMERAFETNPSNPAIQQEMKRLIGRRDGLEPHKVRLTRGALARMYAHGELYPQAIAELRSALQEDPERPDLQVLLADMYWRTDQRKEANKVANQVLTRLPYCLEANRILAANLQQQDRVEEAAVYHRRLAGLDPYAAYVESAMADPAAIEESAVSIERLDWQPGGGEQGAGPAAPGWAATLGMEMKQSQQQAESGEPELPQTGPLPSWLEPGEPPPFEAEPIDSESEDQGSEVGDHEPDSGEPEWLAEEAESMQSTQQPEPSESEDEFMRELGEAGEIEPEAAEAKSAGGEAEIPDWMKEAGWTESTGEAVDGPVSFSDAELRSLEAGELPSEEPATADEQDGELAPAELPDWVQSIAPGDEQEAAGKPDWVPEPGVDEQDQPSDSVSEPEVVQPIPAEAEAEFELPDEEQTDAGPEFPAAEEPQDEPSFPAAESDGRDLPTWITEEAPGATDTIVTWLGGQAQESEAQADETEDLPEWMKDTGPLVDSGDAGIGIPAPTTEPDEQPEAAPDWMGEAEQPEPAASEMADEPAAPTTEAESEELEAAELPNWLSAVAEVAAEEEGAEPAEDQEELDDWSGLLSEEAGDQPPAAAEAIEQTPVSAEQPTEGLDAFIEELEAEDLAAEQQAETSESEAELGQAQTDDSLAASEPPDWISEVVSQPAAPVSAGEIMPESEQPGDQAELEVQSAAEGDSSQPGMEWLAEDQEAGGERDAETPDWLRGLAEEGAEARESSRSEDAPDWLRQIADPDSVVESSQEQASQPEDGQAEPEQIPEPPTPEKAPEPVAPQVEMEEGSEQAIEAMDLTPEQLEPSPSSEPVPEIAPDAETAQAVEAQQSPAEQEPEIPAPAEPELPTMDETLAKMETPPHGTPIPEWLQGIGEEPQVAPAEGGVPDWLGDIGDETPAATVIPEAPTEAEPEPEAEMLGQAAEEADLFGGTPPADVDEDVISWLEDLAAAQEETAIPDSIQQQTEAETTQPVMEEREIPEEPEEGLEWLEQLAEQRGLDVDVNLPEAATTRQPPQEEFEPEPAEPEEQPALSAEDSAPDWLTRMSTQPIPKIDAETLEAAAEESEAVTVPPGPEIDPAAVTIKARPDELRDQLAEAAPPATEESEPEAEAMEQEPVDEDEVPTWLVEAAGQEAEPEVAEEAPAPPVAGRPVEGEAELAAEAPAEIEEEAEPVGEPEPEAAVEAADIAATAEIAEPEMAVPPAAEAEAAEPAAEAEPAESPMAELPAEAEAAEPAMAELPAEAEAAEPAPEPVAEIEAAEPAMAEPAAEAEAVEPEAPAGVTEPKATAPEKPDHERTLDQSRQALASGEVEEAVKLYGGLIKRKQLLDEVIEDLLMAVDRSPDNPALWQTLGDAYMKNDQSTEAIDAYRKGMEVA